MPNLKDRVQETTTSTGTGTIVLANVAASGCQTFAQAYGSDNVSTAYCIKDASGNAEVGRGRFLGLSNDGVLLLHGEGTNGGSTITDSSAYGKTVTNTGVTTSTAQFAFGASSMNFDGVAGRLDLPLDSDLTFGTNDFTLECMVRPTAVASRQNLFYLNANSSGYAAIAVQICATGKLGLSISENGGSWRVDDSTTGVGSALTANVWQHVAVTRLGSVFTLWLGGVSQGTYTPLSGAGVTLMSTFTLNQIGCYNTSSYRYAGFMDELRVTNKLARYTTTFTPPALAFTLADKQLTRERVMMSTNSGALVSFGAGTKDVFVTADADFVDNGGIGMQLAMRGLCLT